MDIMNQTHVLCQILIHEPPLQSPKIPLVEVVCKIVNCDYGIIMCVYTHFLPQMSFKVYTGLERWLGL